MSFSEPLGLVVEMAAVVVEPVVVAALVGAVEAEN